MIDITKPVKLVKPGKGEEYLQFLVREFNEETQRCIIIPINFDFFISPGELVSINDIENILK